MERCPTARPLTDPQVSRNAKNGTSALANGHAGGSRFGEQIDFYSSCPAPTFLTWFGLTLFAPGRACARQAVTRDRTLVDDFVIDHRPWVMLVRNAPSPAASASLAIAEHIVDEMADNNATPRAAGPLEKWYAPNDHFLFWERIWGNPAFFSIATASFGVLIVD